MSKMYALTAGEYSSYHIVNIYSTKEKAELAAKHYQLDDNGFGYLDTYQIEEYEVDVEPPVITRTMFSVFGWFDKQNRLSDDHLSFEPVYNDEDIQASCFKSNNGNGSSLEMIIERRKEESPDKFVDRAKKILIDTYYAIKSGQKIIKKEVINGE